jgi:hypothetical protein
MAGVETGALMPEILFFETLDNSRASVGGFIEAIVDLSAVVEVAKRGVSISKAGVDTL